MLCSQFIAMKLEKTSFKRPCFNEVHSSHNFKHSVKWKVLLCICLTSALFDLFWCFLPFLRLVTSWLMWPILHITMWQLWPKGFILCYNIWKGNVWPYGTIWLASGACRTALSSGRSVIGGSGGAQPCDALTSWRAMRVVKSTFALKRVVEQWEWAWWSSVFVQRWAESQSARHSAHKDRCMMA